MQALVMWKLWQFYSTNVPAGKTLLNINLDETSVQLWQARHTGNVAFRKWRTMRKVRKKFSCMVTLKMQRSNMTHVALVCDNMEIQRILPQFLLVSQQVLLAREVPLINAILPINVFLTRGKSSWSNEKTMMILLRKLVEMLADVMHLYQPVPFFLGYRLSSFACHSVQSTGKARLFRRNDTSCNDLVVAGSGCVHIC